MKSFFVYLVGFLIGFYGVEVLASWLTTYDLDAWDYWQRWVIYVMQLLVGWKCGRSVERAWKARKDRDRS